MLKKNIVYKGIAITWFYKVIGVNIIETWTDAIGKLYSAICSVNLYSTEDKLNILESQIIEFKDIREDKFNLTNLYNWLKYLPEFEGSLDI